jgi:hypothetical protein
MSSERVSFIFSAAIVAIANLIEKGEACGNIVITESCRAEADEHFDRCVKDGMPRVTSDELKAAMIYIKSRGGVFDLTPRGEAAAAYDQMTQGVGHG